MLQIQPRQFELRSQQNVFAGRDTRRGDNVFDVTCLAIIDRAKFNFAQLKLVRNLIMRSSIATRIKRINKYHTYLYRTTVFVIVSAPTPYNHTRSINKHVLLNVAAMGPQLLICQMQSHFSWLFVIKP